MRSRIILLLLVSIVVVTFLFVRNTVIGYEKQSFYSDSANIVKTFEYLTISSNYSMQEYNQYVMLDEIDLGIYDYNFDFSKSYIAFRMKAGEVIYTTTIVGKMKYKDFTYKNVEYKNMKDKKNILQNRNIDVKKLLKDIDAKSYKEE